MDETPPVDEVAARAKRVLSRACDRGLRLSTAESCTGGLVAALVTDIEGCSHAFECGFVVYTDEAKQDMLGVDPEILLRSGAVSRETAIAMAEGALQRSGADIAVSVTGYAGPAKDGGKEGLVHFALARTTGRTIHEEKSYGPLGRDGVRKKCLETVLDMLESEI